MYRVVREPFRRRRPDVDPERDGVPIHARGSGIGSIWPSRKR